MVPLDVGDVEGALVGVKRCRRRSRNDVEPMCENGIRVLRIIARLNIGGPAIHSILLTRGMQRLGYETLLVAGQVGQEEGDMTYLAEAEGVEPIIIPQLGRKLRLSDDLSAFFRILRLLFTFQPHIVHTHTAKAGTLGRLAAFLYNTVQSLRSTPLCLLQKISIVKIRNPQSAIRNPKSKVLHTFHGHVLRGYFSPFKSRLFQGIEKILAKFTDAIVVVSESQKRELCSNYHIALASKFRVIPLGFDLEPFLSCKDKPHTSSLTPHASVTIGIIGRLTPINNHRLFLEAARLLVANKRDTRTRFIIVGDGELRRDLEDLTQQLALADRVMFTGWLKDLTSLYADLDVLALTSDNEGTPVAVIEAMAAGVPVVAADVGGVRELIAECARLPSPGANPPAKQSEAATAKATGGQGLRSAELEEGEFEICERGLLVKPGDVEGFARGLQYLLEHPDVCREMGQRGREYAMKHHGKERLVADMDRLYRSLLQ
jgi:glycosyltransferase involved in cell wall biosynthesis